ncbi:MAG: alpha/beta hydrolase [Desulfuromonadaceae bacterium]|nr:alpha/beta hydrolase [Desulfuromonadaceae bacterium]
MTKITCLVAVLFVCLLSGCVPSATVPLQTLNYPLYPQQRQKTLLVLLRGIGGQASDFKELGLVDMIQGSAMPCDVLVPDAHYGYYRDRSVVERLKQDVIDPARAQGYQHIWLAGFSMGGIGCLFYLREHPQDIETVLLISPFLGWDSQLEPILAAGDLRCWQPSADEQNDFPELLWLWIKQYQQQPSVYPPIHLIYAANDWITGDGPALLATVLPASRVIRDQGGHDNETLVRLFGRLFLPLSSTAQADEDSLRRNP